MSFEAVLEGMLKQSRLAQIDRELKSIGSILDERLFEYVNKFDC